MNCDKCGKIIYDLAELKLKSDAGNNHILLHRTCFESLRSTIQAQRLYIKVLESERI